MYDIILHMEKLPKEFSHLEEIGSPFKKRLYFAGILTKYLEKKKIKPIVVGGNAVEFYTLGSYATEDLDIVAEGYEEMKTLLEEWGFEKIGRLWVNLKLGIEVDIVSDSLAGDYTRISEVEVEKTKVYIIGIEDIIIDRLNAWVWWNSEEDGKWAQQILKLHKREIDEKYLEKRAREEGTLKELRRLESEEI